MKRTYDPVIDHFDLAPIHREPVIRSLFRAVRRPIRRALIRRELSGLEAEMTALGRLKGLARAGYHERAEAQITQQERATQIAINRLIDEDNALGRGE